MTQRLKIFLGIVGAAGLFLGFASGFVSGFLLGISIE